MRAVPGYSYETLLRAVAERDNGKCFVRELLVVRRQAKIDEWSVGQADGMDPACRADWIPRTLLDCREGFDACHVLSKSWLKDTYPVEPWCSDCNKVYPLGTVECVHAVMDSPPSLREPLRAPDETVAYREERFPLRSLADLLNDPRNCVLNCRRHHGLMDGKLVVVRRADLPEHVEEFARDLGDRAVARLERDFARAPVSPVELRTGG